MSVFDVERIDSLFQGISSRLCLWVDSPALEANIDSSGTQSAARTKFF